VYLVHLLVTSGVWFDYLFILISSVDVIVLFCFLLSILFIAFSYVHRVLLLVLLSFTYIYGD
jgi:hypothetical protein